MNLGEYLKGMIMKKVIIEEDFVKGDIKIFLKNVQENKLDVSKVKQEIRKELNDFIDEIFGGK